MTAPRLIFEMECEQRSGLVVGCLKFVGFDGHIELELEASSGLPKWQNFGHWVLKGRGPIPPTRMLPPGVEWELSLLPEQRPNDVGIEGAFYRISPMSVEVAPGLSRDGFGYHKDRNAVGSKGCIYPVEASRASDVLFLESETVFRRWQSTGLTKVPLTVNYY